MWKGAIAFGLVTVPVSLYAATERAEKLSFHLLHAKDGARIDYKRFCVKEDEEVPWREIVKGYEYEKGRFVVLTEGDFAKARTPATEAFDIRAFVEAGAIDVLHFETPYYLAPSGKSGVKAYALLRDALEETGRVGVGTIVLRQREHLAALAPFGDALVLTTMRFAHEIRSPKDLALPRRRTGYPAREMKLAHQLIETLSAPWDPTEFQDTYTDVLKRLIARKIEGKALTVPEVPTRPKVTDLAEALRRSLQEGRRPRAGARRRPARHGKAA
jgi:DNA end-binding protein Ku